MSGFRIGKYEGHWLYSLPDIMAQVDKYGYKNNIICGFNCRHKLHPYHGQLAPEHFEKEDVKRQRLIENKIRQMEREIRKVKENAYLAEKAGDAKEAKILKRRSKYMVERYKSFCDRNGYAWENYRIQINYAQSV